MKNSNNIEIKKRQKFNSNVLAWITILTRVQDPSRYLSKHRLIYCAIQYQFIILYNYKIRNIAWYLFYLIGVLFPAII